MDHEIKFESELILDMLEGKVSSLNASVTGLTYVRLYTTLQQLHMQGEYAAVTQLGTVLNQLLQGENA